MNNITTKHILSIMNLAIDGSAVVSKHLKMTSRRHAVARCRAAARSTSDKILLQLNVLPQADVP